MTLPLCLASSSEAFQKGGRKGAKKVMIVITDGESHDSPDLEKVIQQSERDNVTRYAVAVSPGLPKGCRRPLRGFAIKSMGTPRDHFQAEPFRGRTVSQVSRPSEEPPISSSKQQIENLSALLWSIHKSCGGINPETFLNEIKYIASDPDDKHFFNVTDEAALKDIVDALGDRIFSLEGTNKNETSFGLEMSQTGFSSHVVEVRGGGMGAEPPPVS
ncbi:Integrin alpha-11 [Saguinus oedipus]|uniref:Integrin alpha-11 n=1 Tax=Saguinus oedipus TaxID=9490 RepID=A0ABQ9V1H7_SAGOE|nr:Integrin alpha-11 [Saguinus oedipus]